MAANPFPVPLPAGYDIKKQAIILPGSQKPGQTGIYVSAAFPNLPGPDSDPRFPKSAYEIFNTGLASNPDSPCLGHRPWNLAKNDWDTTFTWESYKKVDERRTLIGSGLAELQKQGLVGSAGATDWAVGIWSTNRPEWQWASQACSAYSLRMVSLYDTLGPNVVEFCVNHSEVRVVFAAPAHIPALLTLAGVCPTLKAIVSVDSWAEIEARGTKPGVKSQVALKAWGKDRGVTVIDIDELQALGSAHLFPHVPPHRKSIASICYTSGTTGNPKGAVLTHELLAAATIGNLHGSSFEAGGILFSYLPLSHIYERFVEDVCLATGAGIGYSCGDNLRLLEDLALLKPTFFVSVPRVLNRIYQALKAGTVDAPGFKGVLTRKAFGDKLWNLKHKGTFEHAFWDRVVFKKIRMALGGNVKMIGSGSAPISPEVLDFLKVAFSCEVNEGYGQTENAGTAVKCVDGDHAPDGSVGPPTAGVEVKLVDVPEMGYFSTDKPVPRGEMCTRGLNVMQAYYKDEAKTAETIDSDGWLHSGDIASVDAIGRFKIIDRIKNLVKLSQGEYVALEKVENVYTLCPLLAQIYVHADSLEDHVVAIVIPDPIQFAILANKTLGTAIAPTDIEALEAAAKDTKVVQAVADELAPYAQKARLLGYEKIGKDIFVTMDQFTQENDLLTPTFKCKRNVAAQVYKSQLAALYKAHPKKAVAKL